MTDAARHPVVVELFRMLPPAGSVWPHEERALWFEAMVAVLALLYPVRGVRIEIGVQGPAVHVVRSKLNAADLADLMRKSQGPIVTDVQDITHDSAAVAERAPSIDAIVPSDDAAAPEPEAPPAPEIKVGDVVTEPDGPLDGAVITKVLERSRLAPAVPSPRPDGIPTTFAMIQAILGDKPGQLTARDLVEAMAARWWPELEFKRVAPDISTWITKGRIARDADGKLTLTEQGRNVPSVDLRRAPAAEKKAPPRDEAVAPAAPQPPPEPPPAPPREVSPAAKRFAEMRAQANAPAPKPTPPQPPKPVALPAAATHQFGYAAATVPVTLKEHRILSKLKAAMGKGMLDGMHLVSVAFAGEAAKVSNSEVYLRELMEQLGPRLDILGLEMVGVPVMPGSSRIAGYVLRAK